MQSMGGLRRSLVGAIATAIGGMVLLLLLLEDPLVQFRMRQLASDTLETALDRFEQGVRAGDDPDEVADEVGATLGVRITVSDATGRVVGDSGYDGEALQRARALVEPGTEQAAGLSADRSRHVLHRRIDRFAVQASMPAAVTERARESIRELLILGGIMAALMAVFLTSALTRTLIEPARELTRVADAMAAGNLTARFGTERDDELGAIGRALDRMAGELGERVQILRQEQDRMRTILDAMVEAVFVTDPLGRITLTNRALAEMVDGDPIGRTAREVVQSDELHAAVRAARKAEARGVDLVLEREGERRYFRAHVAPLPDGSGVVSVLHDLTRLEAADRIRRDFVANASHELRTPLTAIRGFAETLRAGALADPASGNRFLDIILKHTLRLQALVADLAALSRAESPDHRLEVEPVDVQSVVIDVVRGLTTKAAGREVQLVFRPGDEDSWALANERALDQVMVNLVDNATKYAPPGASVHVGIERSGEHVRVVVHNPGPGIAKDHHDRIFERFYRIDEGRSRDVGGTGLGLAIVKHLTFKMGGEVGVESYPGEGVTFWVSLPWFDREGPERHSFPPKAPSAPPMEPDDGGEVLPPVTNT